MSKRASKQEYITELLTLIDYEMAQTINPEYLRIAGEFRDAVPSLFEDAMSRGRTIQQAVEDVAASFRAATLDIDWLRPTAEQLATIRSTDDEQISYIRTVVHLYFCAEHVSAARKESVVKFGLDAMARYLKDPVRYVGKLDVLFPNVIDDVSVIAEDVR